MSAVTAIAWLSLMHGITSDGLLYLLLFVLFFQLPYLLLLTATLFPAPPHAIVPPVKFGLITVGSLAVFNFPFVLSLRALGDWAAFGYMVGGCVCLWSFQVVFALAAAFGAFAATADSPPPTQPPLDTP